MRRIQQPLATPGPKGPGLRTDIVRVGRVLSDPPETAVASGFSRKIRVLHSGGSEAASRGLAQLGHLVPADARRWQDNPLGEAVSTRDVYFAPCEIQHRNHHLVVWPGIVGIYDTDAVGDGESALER